MTATVGSYFFDCEITNKTSDLLSYKGNPAQQQVEPVCCISANTPFSTSAAPLLDRKVGRTSVLRLHQRRHSECIHVSKFNPNHLTSSFRRENCLQDWSYSETREMLKPTTSGCFSIGGCSQINSSRYKTELCRPFEENGSCKYGDKCQFAHGLHELRSLSRHPKYKTELCRTFHTIGFCPYGPRCHFIHNAEERRGPPSLSNFNKMKHPRLQHSWSFAGFPSLGGTSENPTSITPPPLFSMKEQSEWPVSTFTYTSQEFEPSIGGPPALELPAPPSPTMHLMYPMSESPPSPTDSLSDHEGYQSSLGSYSDSESLDVARRLPIFSQLSVSDD